MDMYVYKKDYFKEAHEVQNAILSAVKNLYERICLYEAQKISFDRIFNDDRVKYDKHGHFYTFKFQHSNMQLRILYTYLIIDGNPVIIVADFAIKKRNNKKYIKQFEAASSWNPIDVYNNSKLVMSF